MAKSKIVYKLGDQPRNKLEISKEYIQDFYAANYKAGKISDKELEEWIETVRRIEAEDESAMTKFAQIRKEFVELHFPHLDKKNENSYSAFFESLKKSN